MKWFIKRHIFNFRSMWLLEYDLNTFDPDGKPSQLEINGIKIVPVRLRAISEEYENRLEKAIRRMDIKPNFTVEGARERLKKGFVFTVAETQKGDIVGWLWTAKDDVFFEDFNCRIALDPGVGFEYNLYVEKAYRGKRVIHLIRNEQYRNLKNEGFRKMWGLVYDENRSSLKSMKNYGWKEVGKYRFLKFMLMNFRFPPKK